MNYLDKSSVTRFFKGRKDETWNLTSLEAWLSLSIRCCRFELLENVEFSKLLIELKEKLAKSKDGGKDSKIQKVLLFEKKLFKAYF